MSFAWNPLALVGLAAILVGWSAAIIVFATGPSRPQNRLLALVLLSEGTAVGLARGVSYLTSDVPITSGMNAVITSLEVIATVAYLLLLATLETPLTRPLKPLWVRGSIVAFAAVWSVYMNLGPLAIWPTVYMINFEIFTYVGVYGFAVALSAWFFARRGTWKRRQAGAYALAFGLRDVAWFGYLHVIYPTWGGTPGTGWSVFFAAFAPSITIAFVLLLVYAILRVQLFDLDLKLKWSLRHGTVVAIFAAVFIVVAQVAQEFLSGAFGWLAGGVAAGAMIVAIRPIERAADRIADRTMPKVHATPAYVAFQKMEVYKAAVEEVLADGAVSEKDRRVLERLRAHLGLTADDARAMESDVARSGRPIAELSQA